MASAPTPTLAPVPDSADPLPVAADPPFSADPPPAAMSPPAESEAAPQLRPAWGRRPGRGMFGGVCAGVAQYTGIDATIVRVVLAMMVAVGGVGIGIYALAWALMPVAPEAGLDGPTPIARAQGAGILLLTFVVLAGLKGAGVHIISVKAAWPVWPVVVGACGTALVWRATVGIPTAGRRNRGLLRETLRHARWIDIPRIAVGALLVAFASAAVLHTIGTLHSLGAAVAAVAIVMSVIGLLLGPWFMRLGRSLASERTARIREQERAEMAAHLHDSVLQTLALIQNRAADAQQVATLARRQERELRRWLFDRSSAGGDSIKAVMERAATEVEELHGVPIEVVIVGDVPVDARLEALVLAAREAMTNAAKFADSGRIDLYVEVGDGHVEAFVRDRGVGFDPGAIPEDRRGVRDSIVGRMQRHGGRGTVHSAPGEGTEVELVMGPASA